MGMGAGVWNKAFILAEMIFYEPVNIALPDLYHANYQNLASGVRSSKKPSVRRPAQVCRYIGQYFSEHLVFFLC